MGATPGKTRVPAVAGRFYAGDAATLARDVRSYLEAGAAGEPASVCGVMAPHAGYVYSGGIAGQVFARVRVPERVIILCPNHTGRGVRISVVTEGAFAIPGAEIPIDTELAAAVLDHVPGAESDRAAHAAEHAIEVELPFLLARQPNLRIVPIVLSGLSEAEAIGLGESLFSAVQSCGADALIVASSDMSHFLTDERAREVDHLALEPLLAFDPSGLYRTVVTHDISMCGFIPTTAMLSYCRKAGSAPPELVGYATSGDAFGDRSRVVGYAGVVVSNE
jgi:hypothetical protein